MDALTRSFAFELGRDGIRVNAIRPGFTVTEGNAPILALPGIDEELLHRVPMRRWAQPSDIADYALFLLSDQSAFITDTTTLADGGLAMNSYPDINALAVKAMAAAEQEVFPETPCEPRPLRSGRHASVWSSGFCCG